MKTAFSIAVLAVLLVAPGECFAEWDIENITKDRAKEMGMEVRSVTPAAPTTSGWSWSSRLKAS